MQTITFTERYEVRAAGGPTYDAGQTVDLPDDSAQHFISRRVAVAGKPAEGGEPGDNGGGNTKKNTPPGNPDPNIKNAALTELGLPTEAIAELSTKGVVTVEQFAAYAADNNLQQLPKVGKATARQIAAALAKLTEEQGGDGAPDGDGDDDPGNDENSSDENNNEENTENSEQS